MVAKHVWSISSALFTLPYLSPIPYHLSSPILPYPLSSIGDPLTRLSESRRTFTPNPSSSAAVVAGVSGTAHRAVEGQSGGVVNGMVDATLRATVVNCIIKALAANRSMPQAQDDTHHHLDGRDLVGQAAGVGNLVICNPGFPNPHGCCPGCPPCDICSL